MCTRVGDRLLLVVADLRSDDSMPLMSENCLSICIILISLWLICERRPAGAALGMGDGRRGEGGRHRENLINSFVPSAIRSHFSRFCGASPLPCNPSCQLPAIPSILYFESGSLGHLLPGLTACCLVNNGPKSKPRVGAPINEYSAVAGKETAKDETNETCSSSNSCCCCCPFSLHL